MPWYSTGTVTATLNSNVVNGNGTSFAVNSRVGDAFRGPDGRFYEVTNIPSNTSITINPPYQGPTVTGGYALAPMQGYVKDSADALRQFVNAYGSQLAALRTTGNYDILPLTKGGTGRTDGRVVFTEVVANGAPALNGQQGMSVSWNELGTGEGNFTVNKGGGTGGFTWRTVNQNNTVGGPRMVYSEAGILSVPQLSVTQSPIAVSSGGTGGTTQAAARTGLGFVAGQSVTVGSLELIGAAPYLDFHYNNTTADYDVRMINDSAGVLTLDGIFRSKSTRCRTGLNGSWGATGYNFNWTGSNVDVYIDATYVGTMTLFTSDYRIKKYIKDAPATSYLDRIDAYRVVTYQRKNFGDVFKGGTTTFQGLVAHEAQAVNPFAASGEKDGVDGEGNPLIQQLDPMALITDLIGAVKELRAEVNLLKAELAAIKQAPTTAPSGE